MRQYSYTFLCSLFLGTSCGANEKLPVRATTSSLSTALQQLRGGAGPLDRKLVSKAFLGSHVATSIPMILAPLRTAAFLGASSKVDALTAFIVERIGVASLSFAILAYQMVVQGGAPSDLSQAVATSLVPYIALAVKTLWIDQCSKANVPPGSEALTLTIATAVTYACLNQHASLPTRVLDWYSYFMLAHGAFLTLFPGLSSASWGTKWKTDQDKKLLVRLLGMISGGGIGLFILLINEGKTPHEALGICAGVLAFATLANLTANPELGGEAGRIKSGLLLSFVGQIVAALTLAVPKKSAGQRHDAVPTL